MPCISCPFNDGITQEATEAQNWACLPSASEMISTFDQSGIALSCHHDLLNACRGLAGCRETSGAAVLSYHAWYHGAAVENENPIHLSEND